MEDTIQALNPEMILFFITLVIGDIAIGASRAMKEGRFRAQYLATGIKEKAFPYSLSLISLKVISAGGAGSGIEAPLDVVWTAAWGTICLAVLGSIVENTSAIIGKAIDVPNVKAT